MNKILIIIFTTLCIVVIGIAGLVDYNQNKKPIIDITRVQAKLLEDNRSTMYTVNRISGVIAKAGEELPTLIRGTMILYVDPLTQCHFIQVGNDTFMRLDENLNQIGCRWNIN